MATPRKNWFKVPDSIAFDNLTNDELAGLIRLQGYMNTRWARDGKSASERGHCTITPALAKQITGKHRADIAATSLRHLADITSISVRYDGDIASISWPKYAEFQAVAFRESPAPSPITKTSPRREKKRDTASASRPSVCPEDLPEREAVQASEWGTAKGFTPDQMAYAWERVRDWARSKQIMRVDWVATLRNAMTDGWALKGFASGASVERESPAQARERRTKDAMAEAFRRMTGGEGGSQPPLIALAGGRE